MPHRSPHYIQKKIELIEQGLPIDVSENELKELETVLQGAKDFYLDIVHALQSIKTKDTHVVDSIAAEKRNIAGIELALRKIDEFRLYHSKQIKNVQ